MSDFEFIEFYIEDQVAFIRLNQPDSLNAMTERMAGEVSTALDRASDEAGAVILTGAGRSFCSGANLKENSFDLDDPTIDMGIRLQETYNPLLTKMKSSPVPIVTAIRGAAAGIGSSMALMGDIIVTGHSAYFLQAFCNIGLVPDGGAPYLLSRAIGRVRAMELVLLGEKYRAEKAYADGLVTRYVEDDEVEPTAWEIAKKLAHGPTKTLKMIRQSTWAAYDTQFEDQLASERNLQREAGRTKDFAEGVTAFIEKRKAIFRGA